MLNLLGRSAAERLKSVTIVLLTAVLVSLIWQMSNQGAAAASDQAERDAAVAAAWRFAIALTTYDFAHPDVQVSQVGAVSSVSVRDRVRMATADLVAAKASSVGDPISAMVVSEIKSTVNVVVRTSQVVSGSYVRTGVVFVGLLSVTVTLSNGRSVVTDYRWIESLTTEP